MADNFIRRLTILQMLKPGKEHAITIPQIFDRLRSMEIEVNNNKAVERDMTFLSSQFLIGCDVSHRPFLWWWDSEEIIEIPGMGRNSALTFFLAQKYLEPLLPKQSLKHLNQRFRESRNVLLKSEKTKEKKWINKIKVIPKQFEQLPAKVSESVQRNIYDALFDEKQLVIQYDKGQGDVSNRRVHPLGLVYRHTTSELIALDEKDNKTKRFILNRIKQAKIQLRNVVMPKDFDLDAYLEKQLAFPGTGEILQFKARLSHFARNYVEETPLSPYQTIEKDKDGGVIVKAEVRDTRELVPWILSLGAKITVYEPKSLVDYLAGVTKQMAANYQ